MSLNISFRGIVKLCLVPAMKNLDKIAPVVVSFFSIMRRLSLALLSSSLGWVLLHTPAFASDASRGVVEFSSLSASGAVLAQEDPSSPALSCSIEEQEAALSRFGCSCSTCISAVKQVRDGSPLQPQLLDMVRHHQGPLHTH